MNKNGKSKLMPLLVTLILLASMLFVITPTTVAQEIEEVSKTDDLTCGEEIWVNGTDLTEDERYYIFIENETGGWELIDDQRADDDGEIAVEINVPYRNPLGEYDLALSDSDDSADIFDTTSIWINNTFWVRYKVGGDFLDYVIYNNTYEDPQAFFIYVYNWTGSRYELVEEDITIELQEPDGTVLYTKNTDVGYWDLDITFDYDDNGNFETDYLVDVELDADTAQNSLAKLPVKLDVTATLPTDVEWGDTVTISGYVRDGNGDGIPDYTVSLYSPGSWHQMDTAVTYASGRFSLSAATDSGSAGTWYIGTEQTGGTYRIDETHKIDIDDFIKYFSFEVASDDTARVELESPDEVISGFTQTLNVSVYNSWDDDYYDEMWIHITGLECVFQGTSYDDDDIVIVHPNTANSTSSNEKHAYYEFNIKFNETGTATIIVTHPDNNTVYEDLDELAANISGTETFSVVSPDDMNIIVEDMPETVMIEDNNGVSPPNACHWINKSTMIKIFVYGDDQDEPKNASITIKGAGINIKIDEDDEIGDVDELVNKADGQYWVMISPKKAGIVTITVENESDNMTGSKDFTIKGLSGSVTTSIGDDLEMSVRSTEIITVNIANGQYAEVHLTYYDENWDFLDCMNDTVGENEAGNGLNGEFEFYVIADDIEDGVGYIVVAAWAGADFFFYDIVEVAPVHDFIFEIIEPEDALNQTLTVGLEHEWEFKIMDGDGNLIDDVDTITGEIYDPEDKDDILQEFELKEKSGSIWYMDEFIPHFEGELLLTAVNNTGEDEHDGNLTLDVGLATITYSPAGVTAGIGIENLTVEIMGVDANGNLLPDGTKLYLNIDDAAGTDTDPAEGDSVTIDEDGMGEFEIEEVGDEKGKINFTFWEAYNMDYCGNKTDGHFEILYPTFVVDPATIYIGMSNQITITAYDYDNNPIEGINITLLPSTMGIIPSQPDPVETDAVGQVVLSVQPVASGKLNVTIARDLRYVNGQLMWDNTVVTDTTITATSLKPLSIELSKSPIFQGETLTVTVKSGDNTVSGATVKFGQETKTTDASGEADFTVPDPGVESATYKVTASKEGYTATTEDITVIKKYQITITGPAGEISAGQEITVTILAKGSALAGATVTIDGQTYTSNENGKVTLTVPSTEGTYTITATFEPYIDGTLTVTIVAGGIPGFEVLTLIAAIGVAFIVLKRRKH